MYNKLAFISPVDKIFRYSVRLYHTGKWTKHSTGNLETPHSMRCCHLNVPVLIRIKHNACNSSRYPANLFGNNLRISATTTCCCRPTVHPRSTQPRTSSSLIKPRKRSRSGEVGATVLPGNEVYDSILLVTQARLLSPRT